VLSPVACMRCGGLVWVVHGQGESPVMAGDVAHGQLTFGEAVREQESKVEQGKQMESFT
jgi:hypothetical protein